MSKIAGVWYRLFVAALLLHVQYQQNCPVFFPLESLFSISHQCLSHTDSCAVGRGNALPPVWHHCAEEGWMWLAALHRLSHWDLLGDQRTPLGARGKKSFLCFLVSLPMYLPDPEHPQVFFFEEKLFICNITQMFANSYSDPFQGTWWHQWRMSLQRQ